MIYDWDRSPNCLKTKILLYELGIPFEQTRVGDEELRGARYRATYPTGMAPAIDDDDLRIAESSAIALHLAEKHGKLMPTDPRRRALAFQAIAFESAQLAPTMGGQGLFGELARPAPNQERIGELREKAQRMAAVLSAFLGSREYFAEIFTIADIQLYAATAKSIEAGAFTAPAENLRAWHARVSARPAVTKARAEYVHYR